MADLASLGHVAPSEFEEMLFSDSNRLARSLREKENDRKKFEVEMLKVLVRSNGARID